MYHKNRTSINDNWLFRFGNDVEKVVALPHTWNALDTMETELESHYRRGVGHYQRPLPSQLSSERRHFIHFGAAAMRAKVWCGDVFLGEHLGGYTPFALELPTASLGDEIRIEVDNTPDIDLIPSDLSDFFLYGGVTRNVWLYETGAVRLARLHIQQTAGADRVELTVVGAVDCRSSNTQLELEIRDPSGAVVSRTTAVLDGETFAFEMPPVSDPLLWSTAEPVLYDVTGRLFCDGELSDEIVERIGFRTFEFPEGGPFYLNGERLLLRGTHRHEDWAGLGCAVPDHLSRDEMEKIKDAGFNFVRLGHYPQAEAVLDACDELGLIVWEEIPWCRGGVGDGLFKQRTRQMLDEMVDHHFNRPSIIFWGLGNELDWESDHVHTTDDDVYAFLEELHALSHQLDPSRLTALRRYDRGASAVDVYSPSIWSGWYRGRYEDYEAVLRDAMSRFPRMIHTEWGGDNHIGRHNSGPHIRRAIATHTTHEENPGVALSSEGEARASLDGDWSESYMLDLMEWHLQVQNRLPNLAGTAQWAFKDFGTPLRPENPIPYVNQKGLLSRSGERKDVYFMFQAYQTETPVCYIESPSWPIRTGAPEAQKRIRVYSNCEQVELWVNGRSCGAKQLDPTASPAGGLVWFVSLQLGKNDIRAVGTAPNGEAIEHMIEQTFAPDSGGKAAALQGRLEFGNGADETAVLATIQMVSEDGDPILDDERRVLFSLRGDGSLCSHQGTPTGSKLVETANGRASIVILGADQDTAVVAHMDGLPELIIQR